VIEAFRRQRQPTWRERPRTDEDQMAMVVAGRESSPKPSRSRTRYRHHQYATPSGGSKTVPTEAPAVRNAAVQVKQKLMEMAAEALKADLSELVYQGREIVFRQDASKRIAVKDLEALKR
jgi:CO/xanthine dehydrogenase Mo-binding subunit